jgi:hypothetical protein
MNDEEMKRRFARPRFVEPGDRDYNIILPMPAFVTRVLLSDLYDVQPGDSLEEILSKPKGNRS